MPQDDLVLAKGIIEKHRGKVYGIYEENLGSELSGMVSYNPGIVNLVFSQLLEQGYDSTTIIKVARTFLDKTASPILGTIAKTPDGSALLTTVHRILKCGDESNVAAARCVRIKTAFLIVGEKDKTLSPAIAYNDVKSVRIELPGTNGQREVKIYQTNQNGMINVRELSSHPCAKFIVADGQNVPEEYLSAKSSAGLFNIARAYNEVYASDNKLVFTAGSASSGSPGICTTKKGKKPCHDSHQKGSCVDLRYISGNGKDLTGDDAYKNADVQRTVWLIKEFGKIGFPIVYTGDDGKFGLPDNSPKYIDGLEVVHRHHIHIAYKPV